MLEPLAHPYEEHTYDVVVVQVLELVAPEVGGELLKLDGEARVGVGFIAGEQQVGVLAQLAPVCLLALRHQVQLIELVLPRRGRGTHQVQTVPHLRV